MEDQVAYNLVLQSEVMAQEVPMSIHARNMISGYRVWKYTKIYSKTG